MSLSSRRARSLLAVVGATAIVLTMALPASAAIFFRERYRRHRRLQLRRLRVRCRCLRRVRRACSRSGRGPASRRPHSSPMTTTGSARPTCEATARPSSSRATATSSRRRRSASRVRSSRFRSVNAGQLFTARDSAGNVIFRDRGAVVETILFDTLGDGEPGGEFIDVLDTTFHGKFPSVEGFCTIWD